ncbi:MAG TPA: hypothetical protein PKV71_12720 [Calditrichia bacterium]|nr:hypothetical protein [Calditrichota bacterium]HQU73643.1 hypothetical protein [Calditrichia bacterium]HQV32739.1 hypothetical protein [Calditrichia bacterium]
MRNLILLSLVFYLTVPFKAQSQNQYWGNPLIEIGLSQNTLLAADNYLGNSAIREDTFLKFSGKLGTSYHLFQSLNCLFFTGYSEFGGKQKLNNNYRDEFTFRAWELGIIPHLKSGFLSAGFGVKYNYHLKMTGKWWGSVNQSPGTDGEFEERDIDQWYKKGSFDLGWRMSAKKAHVLISFEYWKTLGDLEKDDLDKYVDFSQFNFRFLMGYQF